MRRGWAFALVVVLGLPVLVATSQAVASAPATATASASASVSTATSGPSLAAGRQVTIDYCNHQKARITEPTALHGPAPAAVYVHGGSWVSGDYDTGGFIIDRIGPALASRGFVVVSLNYRLGPRRHWPDQIVDVKCAIRYLRANASHFHIDPERDRRLGPERGRPPGGTARHRRPRGGLGHRRLPRRVERGAGGRRHGGAERPAHPGQPGRGDLRRQELRLTARPRAGQTAGRRPQAGQPGLLRQTRRPAVLALRLEQRRDRLSEAVGGAGLVPRRGAASPTRW